MAPPRILLVGLMILPYLLTSDLGGGVGGRVGHNGGLNEERFALTRVLIGAGTVGLLGKMGDAVMSR